MSSVRALIRRVTSMYNSQFGDESIIRNTVEIVVCVSKGQYPDHEKLSLFYTVGEVRQIKGFYCAEVIVKDMIDMFQARALRGCCLIAGVDTNNPHLIIKFIDVIGMTNIQRDRVYPEVHKQLVQQLGQCEVDQRALDKFIKDVAAVKDFMTDNTRRR